MKQYTHEDSLRDLKNTVEEPPNKRVKPSYEAQTYADPVESERTSETVTITFDDSFSLNQLMRVGAFFVLFVLFAPIVYKISMYYVVDITQMGPAFSSGWEVFNVLVLAVWGLLGFLKAGGE